MKNRTKLFLMNGNHTLQQTDALFLEAMKENIAYHRAHCDFYRKILEGSHFQESHLKKIEDLADIPVLPTLLYKYHQMFSMDEKKILIQATSSGTKGVFSRVGFDAGSLILGLSMVLNNIAPRKLLSLCPVHYVMLGYKPHKSNQTVISKTAFGSSLFAPALSRTFALTMKNGSYELNLDALMDALKKHSTSRWPTRIIGFPSYLFFTLRKMEEKGIFLSLPKGSKIMLGGGWKQFYAEEVDKLVLYGLAKRVLNIDEDQIMEFFGAVEHPTVYCDCPYHHFHVPIYSRIIIRDPKTLTPVPNGTPGLLNLLTPLLKATPLCSVMTDDLAILHDGAECGCGNTNPYVEILGRAGLHDIKTCAAGAQERLEGKS